MNQSHNHPKLNDYDQQKKPRDPSHTRKHPQSLLEKEIHLRQWLRECQSLVIAFSGGVDSTLLAKVATQELGEQAWVVIADSPSLPREELQEALELARTHRFNLHVVTTDEMEDPDYLANSPKRCYHCKKHLYHQLKKIQTDNKLAWIVNGDNWSDKQDFRPGRIAAEENQVGRPLEELQWSKQEIRQLAKKLSLSVHDKPASPCLASRIPHGQAVNQEKLQQVEKAEFFLKKQFLIKDLRVRHYHHLAIIETLAKDFNKLKKNWDEIIATFKIIGFQEVQLNPQPFKSGSLTSKHLGI